jgi:cytoplasmic iron level regulating protein YaaA (DUF328/UPF0246 family)
VKLLVISSCSKTKAISHQNEPDCSVLISKKNRKKYLEKFETALPAFKMYQGALNKSINQAIKQLRQKINVSYYILSAGFGFLKENDLVPPYNCSFAKMNKATLEKRAEKLEISKDYSRILSKEKPDCLYLALGKKYLHAIKNWDQNLTFPTIAFQDSENANILTLSGDAQNVKKVAKKSPIAIHGVVGFKGDFLLLVAKYLEMVDEPKKELMNLFMEKEIVQLILNTKDKNEKINQF